MAREAARRTRVPDNLKQVGLALQLPTPSIGFGCFCTGYNCHAKYRLVRPVFRQGLTLPYMERSDLYDRTAWATHGISLG